MVFVVGGSVSFVGCCCLCELDCCLLVLNVLFGGVVDLLVVCFFFDCLFVVFGGWVGSF